MCLDQFSYKIQILKYLAHDSRPEAERSIL
jgi:hypothetical protein